MVELIVFDATSDTGRCLLEQTVTNGHIVTALLCDPEGVTIQHSALSAAFTFVRTSSPSNICFLGIIRLGL